MARVSNFVVVLVAAELTLAAASFGGPADGAADGAATSPVAEAATIDASATGRDAVFVPEDEMVEATDLPGRRMPYAYFAEHGRQMIAGLPTLETQARYFPESAMTRDVAEQLEHIAHLAAHAQVSLEGYADFTIDTSRRTAFADLDHYQERIRPRMFIVHWTGIGFQDVDHFVSSLRPLRVQFFMDRDASVYDLFETDRQKPAHAKGANDFSQGVEIETGHFDGSRSPLFSYTPEQIERTVYLAVEWLRRNDLPVDETTLVGHYAADLIFSNPYYDPVRARFTRASLRKFDPPQELMEVIVAEAQALDAALEAQPSG